MLLYNIYIIMRYKIKKRPRRVLKDNKRLPYIKYKNKDISLKGYDIKSILKIINKLSKEVKSKRLDKTELKQKRDKINKYLSGQISSVMSGGPQQIVESRLKEDTEKIKELSNELQLYKSSIINNKSQIKNNDKELKMLEENKKEFEESKEQLKQQLLQINDNIDNMKNLKENIKDFIYYDKNKKKYRIDLGEDRVYLSDTITGIKKFFKETYDDLIDNKKRLEEENKKNIEKQQELDNKIKQVIEEKDYMSKMNKDYIDRVQKLEEDKIKLKIDIREYYSKIKKYEEDVNKLKQKEKDFEELYNYKLEEIDKLEKQKQSLIKQAQIDNYIKEEEINLNKRTTPKIQIIRELNDRFKLEGTIDDNFFNKKNNRLKFIEIYNKYFNKDKIENMEINPDKDLLVKLLLEIKKEEYIKQIQSQQQIQPQEQIQPQQEKQQQQIQPQQQKQPEKQQLSNISKLKNLFNIFKQQESQPQEEEEEEQQQEGEGLNKVNKGGLYNTDIDKIMKPFKDYLGCYANDQIDILIKYIKDNNIKKGGAIINTNNLKDKEGHWVAIWFDTIDDCSFEYFDPFGNNPRSNNFINKFKSMFEDMETECYIKVKINKIKFQSLSSINCGWFSLKFLLERINNITFKDATKYKKISNNENDIKELKQQYNKFGFI